MTDDTQINLEMRRLETDSAVQLGELHLMRLNVRHSFYALKILRSKYNAENQDSEANCIGMSLFRDAIIQVMTCFSTKDANKLRPTDVYGDLENGMELYQWVYDQRVSFAAHMFGASRQCQIYAVLSPEMDKVIGVGNFSMIPTGHDDETIDGLINFVSIAGRFIDEKISKIEAIVRTEAESAPIEEILKLPTPIVVAPGPDEIKTTRAKFQAKKDAERGISR